MIKFLTGFPPCPMCNKILKHRPMPDYKETRWYCTGCDTQWDIHDLIAALNDNEEIAE